MMMIIIDLLCILTYKVNSRHNTIKQKQKLFTDPIRSDSILEIYKKLRERKKTIK